MVRVHGGRRATCTGTGAARHKQGLQGNQKKPYKVVLEEISEQKKLKTFLSFNAKAPPGFTFIPAGDPQLTNRCKQLARDDGSTVYIVSMSDPKNPELSHEVHRVGYHFSSRVVEDACLSLGVTLTESGRVLQSSFATLHEKFPTRQGKKVKIKGKGRGRTSPPKFDLSQSQATIDTQAREAIRDLFPRIPVTDLHETVSRSFQKGRDLVGTSSDLSLVRRAHLAVLAHIRHTHTQYDHLLKLVPWAEARKRVEGRTLDVLISWRDDVDDDTNIMRDVLREVIIISDNDDDDDDIMKGKSSSDRSQSHRERSVEIVSASNNVHTKQLDLAMEPSDSENEQPIHYIPRKNLDDPQRAYNRLREERQGAHRHQRWEQALSRKKNNPLLSAPRIRTTQVISEPAYQKSVANRSINRPRQSQRTSPTLLYPTYDDQKVLQSNAPDRGFAPEGVEYPSCHTMERIIPLNPIRQAEYLFPHSRTNSESIPGHQHNLYPPPELARDHSYAGTREAQQAPFLVAGYNERLAELRQPRKAGNTQYIAIEEPLHRRRPSERILPSVEADDFETNKLAQVAGREILQYQTTTLLEEAAGNQLHHAPRSTAEVSRRNENSNPKRSREGDHSYVFGERLRLPLSHDGRDYAVVPSTCEHTPGRVVRHRAMELMYENEPRSMKDDPRIVHLPSGASERVSNFHGQVQLGSRPRQDENGRPIEVRHAEGTLVPSEHRRFSYAKPAEQFLPPRSYSNVHASPSYVDLPTDAPLSQPSMSRIIRVDNAMDGRLIMPFDESRRNVQYYDEQGRSL